MKTYQSLSSNDPNVKNTLFLFFREFKNQFSHNYRDIPTDRTKNTTNEDTTEETSTIGFYYRTKRLNEILNNRRDKESS